MNHDYHSLPLSREEEGEGRNIRENNDTASSSASLSSSGLQQELLWDQLNDEQSREVLQHQSRFFAAATGPNHQHNNKRTNPVSIAVSIAHSSIETITESIRTVTQRAQIAYRDYKQQQRNFTSTDNEFDIQFGINDLFLRGDEDEDGEQSRQLRSQSLGLDDCNYNDNADNNDAEHQNGASCTIRPFNNKNNKSKRNASKECQPLQGYPFVALKETRRNNDTNPNQHRRRPRPNYDRTVTAASERDRWGMVGNLDVFLSHLYKYYYNRGITPMICSFFVETLCLLFTLWLSRLLLIGMDWSKLLSMNCDNDDNYNYKQQQHPDPNNTCYSHLSDYARTEPLSWIGYLLLQGYTILVVSYAVFNAWMFYQGFGYAIQCRTILHEKLGLSELKLKGGALDWNDVITKLVEGQETGQYRILHHHTIDSYRHNYRNSNSSSSNNNSQNIPSTQSHDTNKPASSSPPTDTYLSSRTTAAPPPPVEAFAVHPNNNKRCLDPLQIAQRIMRKENYMIGFWNIGYLERCTRINGRQYWCSTLEFAIYQCILNFMFNHRYEIRPSFCLESDTLQRRLKTSAIVIAVLEPFLLVFTIIHFVLRHVYDSKATQKYMGKHRWSSAAKWQFREYNELQHNFEKRIHPTYLEAERYCTLFGSSEIMASIGRVLKFVSGSIGTVLLVLGVVVNDALLLHVQLYGRNLVWYAGMAGIAYSIGSALEPTKESTLSVSKNLFDDMDTSFKRICSHTHYCPQHWKNRGWDLSVYNNFKTYFDSEVKLFVHELIALLLTPYILYFRLSTMSLEICEFCLLSKAKLSVVNNSVDEVPTVIPGGGDVLGFSTFDFDTFGDEEWEGRTLGQQPTPNTEELGMSESLSESIMRIGNIKDAAKLHSKPKARNGKMEKSFFTFREAFPNWTTCFPTPVVSSSLNCDLGENTESISLSTYDDNANRICHNSSGGRRRLSNSVQIRREHERELHVKAATKQLETLAKIEGKKQEKQQRRQGCEETYSCYDNGHDISSPYSKTANKIEIEWNDNHYSACNIYSNNLGNGKRIVKNSCSPTSTSTAIESKRQSPPSVDAGAGIFKHHRPSPFDDDNTSSHQSERNDWSLSSSRRDHLTQPQELQQQENSSPSSVSKQSSKTIAHAVTNKANAAASVIIRVKDVKQKIDDSMEEQQQSLLLSRKLYPTQSAAALALLVNNDIGSCDHAKISEIQQSNATDTADTVTATMIHGRIDLEEGAREAFSLDNTIRQEQQRISLSSPLSENSPPTSVVTASTSLAHQQLQRSSRDQYQWLERFHEKLEQQEEEEEQQRSSSNSSSSASKSK